LSLSCKGETICVGRISVANSNVRLLVDLVCRKAVDYAPMLGLDILHLRFDNPNMPQRHRM
jgi:hypothetical protein